MCEPSVGQRVSSHLPTWVLHLKLLAICYNFNNIQILIWANLHGSEDGFAAHIGREKERYVSWGRNLEQDGENSPHSKERGWQRMSGETWQGNEGGLGQWRWCLLCYIIRDVPLASQDSALGALLTWSCFLGQRSLVQNLELWRNVRDFFSFLTPSSVPISKIPVVSFVSQWREKAGKESQVSHPFPPWGELESGYLVL